MEQQNTPAMVWESKKQASKLLDDLEKVDTLIQAHRLKLKHFQEAINAYIEAAEKVLSAYRF